MIFKNHKMTFKMGEILEEATIAEEFVARGYEKHHLLRLQASLLCEEESLIFSHTRRKAHIVSNYGEMKLIQSEVLIKKAKDPSKKSIL